MLSVNIARLAKYNTEYKNVGALILCKYIKNCRFHIKSYVKMGNKLYCKISSDQPASKQSA